MTTSVAPAFAAAATEGPPFSTAPIEDMLRLLAKGVRAHQLYMHNNPTYVRAIELLRAAFPAIWEHTEAFTITVTESEFVWEGVIVLREGGGEASDSLAWVFYKDGVRELRFERGFEGDDLVPFLDVIQRARRTGRDGEDLLVMLWEQELHHLRYRYVDVGDDGAAAVGDFTTHFEPRIVEPPRLDDGEPIEEVLQTSRPGVVNLEDFDSTLHFLDEHEVSYLKTEVENAYANDLRQNVVAILLDIFEAQPDSKVRDEVAHLLDNMMLHFLSAGQFRTVAYLLREAGVAAQRAPQLVPEQRERLAKIPDRLSEPAALSQLLESLDESHDLPPQEDLNALFDELRPAALATVFAWLTRIRDPRLRVLLQTAAERLATVNTAELARLVGHADKDVAIEAIRRAGALGTASAVPPIVKRMEDTDVAIRQAAVHALGEVGSAGALHGLERAIGDSDRDVRIAAVRALAARAYRPALPHVEAVVKGTTLRGADLTERMAMFELYGALCGDGGIPVLDRILNRRSWLRRRADPELRACAAVALGRVGTERAVAALQQAVTQKEVVVRTAVNKALRGGAAGPGARASA